MRAASKRRGIQITSLSRPIRPSDFKEFDLILAMDKQNRGGMISRWYTSVTSLVLFLKFLLIWPCIKLDGFLYNIKLLANFTYVILYLYMCVFICFNFIEL